MSRKSAQEDLNNTLFTVPLFFEVFAIPAIIGYMAGSWLFFFFLFIVLLLLCMSWRAMLLFSIVMVITWTVIGYRFAATDSVGWGIGLAMFFFIVSVIVHIMALSGHDESIRKEVKKQNKVPAKKYKVKAK